MEDLKWNKNEIPTGCKCVLPEGVGQSSRSSHTIGTIVAEDRRVQMRLNRQIHSFQDKIAIVSGPLTKVGKQIVAELSKHDMVVIAVGGPESELSMLQKSLPNLEIIPVDLLNWTETEAALSNIDHIDFLVNCSEFNALKSVADITEDDVDCILRNNLKAIINITRIVVTKFIQECVRGAIVNVSSQASKAGIRNQATFCASKAGLDGYTRAAALELGSFGIRINCINPTVLTSELDGDIWSDSRMSSPMLSRIPLKRFCNPQEIADAIIFLLSDQASLITGVCLPIDGGFSCC
ncbi:hypothetical protein HHI36_001651 [Cryptolaemus montrouzieri]|uniref:L-xylulose reductase n=1 Tax=Cryptolaemus montrouzieri TaxID=559131 RepID=A0ABD2P8Z5_9CUCU